MARVQNTLIGRSSGSVGNVTMLTVWRENVIRSKMSSQTNPNSPSQSLQRSRYNAVYDFYKNARSIIDVGVNYYDKHMSARNKFQKLNLKASKFDNGSPAPEYNLFKTSHGLIQMHRPAESNYSSDGLVFQVFWFTTIPYRGSAIDDVFIVIYNVTQNRYNLFSGAKREDEVVYFPSGYVIQPTDLLYSYVFFRNPITREVSDSVCQKLEYQ